VFARAHGDLAVLHNPKKHFHREHNPKDSQKPTALPDVRKIQLLPVLEIEYNGRQKQQASEYEFDHLITKHAADSHRPSAAMICVFRTDGIFIIFLFPDASTKNEA
jgi:hypothetical protein